MNIRSPHNVTFIVDDGTGQPNKPHYTKMLLKGVKYDDITAYMIGRYGYQPDDKARVIIYLDSVSPKDGWWIKPKDFFVFGDIAYNGETITELKKLYPIHVVKSATVKKNSIRCLHHVEVIGG